MFRVCPKCGRKVLVGFLKEHEKYCTKSLPRKVVVPIIDLQRRGRVERIKEIPPKMKIIWAEKEPLTPRKRCRELKSYA